MRLIKCLILWLMAYGLWSLMRICGESDSASGMSNGEIFMLIRVKEEWAKVVSSARRYLP